MIFLERPLIWYIISLAFTYGILYRGRQLQKKIRDTLRSHLGQNTHVWTTAKPQLDRISGKKDNFLKAKLPWSIGRLRGKPYVRENSNELQIPVKFEHRTNKL